MAKQSLGVRTTNVTIANATVEVIPTSTVVVRVVEIDIFVNAGTQSVFGIGFPAAIGITPTTPTALQLHDARDQAVVATVALAWGTGPTVPAQFLYRVELPATAGAGISLIFPEGIVIPTASSLVVWNLSATSVADITVVVATTPPQTTLSIY